MQTYVIGRDPESQIVLNDKLVSRHHAQLTILDNGQVMIKDFGSVNGTFVNGNRITEYYLNTGDIVKCGSLFLNWAQYTNPGQAYQPMNYQQPNPNQANLHDAIEPINQYNLNSVFKYLTTGIFEVGDLFKTNWDKTYSILFFNGLPIILTVVFSIIAYSKYGIEKFYFFPTIIAMFLFSVSPFITVYLLSINKKVQIDKVILASGIAGFIQFSISFCFLVYFSIFYQHLSSYFENIFFNLFESHEGFNLFILLTTLLLLILVVNLFIAFYVFIYKYFISLGVNRSKSIYLIIITTALNIFFKIIFSYIIFSIAKDRFF